MRPYNGISYPSSAADESGSDEDFMVEDDDDSDYGRSKKRSSKKVIRRGRPERKEKKSPKPRLKATGKNPPRPSEMDDDLMDGVNVSPPLTVCPSPPQLPPAH